jgi:hypothetical protein
MEVSNPVGRPPAIDDFVLSQLTNAFMNGATDAQACLYAGISPATLYRYEELHPEFRERKHLLKDNLVLRAKMNIGKAITEGKVSESLWYLERKAKDEFSTRSEHINANIDATQKLTDEEKLKIVNLLNANTEPRGSNPTH